VKKFLIATALAVTSLTSQAQQTISIIWPFGMGDTQAQYSRSLVEELNKNQKKYKAKKATGHKQARKKDI
jgi:hypothetical protein